MSRWFRHYAGMMRDDKLVRAAMLSKQPVERVVWIWGAILESAAEVNDNGRYDLDTAEIAYFLRADQADVVSVFAALETGGRISAGSVVKWGDRQFLSDKSAGRTRRYRDKRKASSDGDGEPSNQGDNRYGDDDVTVVSRHGDAPETETYTEAETEKKKKGVEEAAPPEKPAAPKVLKGTRIPDDYSPDYSEAITLGLSLTEAMKQAANFKDYWKAKPGAGGVKLDWDATWRVWCRKASDDRRTGSGGPAQTSTPLASPAVWINEDDPRFKPLAERHEAQSGRKIRAAGSRYENGIGAHFPADWVPAKTSVAA